MLAKQQRLRVDEQFISYGAQALPVQDSGERLHQVAVFLPVVLDQFADRVDDVCFDLLLFAIPLQHLQEPDVQIMMDTALRMEPDADLDRFPGLAETGADIPQAGAVQPEGSIETVSYDHRKKVVVPENSRRMLI